MSQGTRSLNFQKLSTLLCEVLEEVKQLEQGPTVNHQCCHRYERISGIVLEAANDSGGLLPGRRRLLLLSGG